MSLRYKEWDLFQNTLQSSPKQDLSKTKTQESKVKAIISIDLRGFRLKVLVCLMFFPFFINLVFMKIWKFYTLIALELFLIIVCFDSLFNRNDTFDIVGGRGAVGFDYFLLGKHCFNKH